MSCWILVSSLSGIYLDFLMLPSSFAMRLKVFNGGIHQSWRCVGGPQNP
jgi:hypothetical protein